MWFYSRCLLVRNAVGGGCLNIRTFTMRIASSQLNVDFVELLVLLLLFLLIPSS